MAFTPPKDQIPPAWLKENGLAVYANFLPWLEKYQAGQIAPWELCNLYILLFLQSYRGPRWANGSLQVEQKVYTRWRGVSLAAQKALIAWAQGQYPIQLYFAVPTPLELLSMQASGKRVLTLLVRPQQFVEYTLGRDPLSFVLHDLEHAYEFFHQEELYNMQKVFYATVLEDYQQGHFEQPLKDELFAAEFAYVISDMNSHPQHLKQTLEHLLKDYQRRQKLTGTD